MKNKYLNIKHHNLRLTKFQRGLLYLQATFEYPFVIIYGLLFNTYGLKSHFFSNLLGIKILIKSKDLKVSLPLIFSALDSVRYGEFDFVFKKIKNLNPKNYLDVSSPRLLPLYIFFKKQPKKIDLINPDKKDIEHTKKIFSFLDKEPKINFLNKKIEYLKNSNYRTYDLITCISVLEHIPNDKEAVEIIWNKLKVNGTLLVSVPCASKTFTEFTNLNQYNLIKNKDENGYYFWQRFYSLNLLKKNIFSITGKPIETFIFAEKSNDIYNDNVKKKMSDKFYPFWRELLFVSNNFEKKNNFNSLNKLGVIAMMFKKNK